MVQWGNSDVWKVGGKVFAIGGWSKNECPAFTFKASDLNFEILRDRHGFRPAPYMASRGLKWIQQFDASDTLDDDLRYYITESYRMVASGLTKKLQKEFGITLND